MILALLDVLGEPSTYQTQLCMSQLFLTHPCHLLINEYVPVELVVDP